MAGREGTRRAGRCAGEGGRAMCLSEKKMGRVTTWFREVYLYEKKVAESELSDGFFFF